MAGPDPTGYEREAVIIHLLEKLSKFEFQDITLKSNSIGNLHFGQRILSRNAFERIYVRHTEKNKFSVQSYIFSCRIYEKSGAVVSKWVPYFTE